MITLPMSNRALRRRFTSVRWNPTHDSMLIRLVLNRVVVIARGERRRFLQQNLANNCDKISHNKVNKAKFVSV